MIDFASLRSLNPIPTVMDRFKVPNRATVIFGLVFAAGLSYAAYSLVRRLIVPQPRPIEELLSRARSSFQQGDFIAAQVLCIDIETLCQNDPEYVQLYASALCLKGRAFLGQGEIRQAFGCANAARALPGLVRLDEISLLDEDIVRPRGLLYDKS